VAFCEQILTPALLAYAGWVMAHAPLVYWGTYQGRAYYEPISVMLGWWLFISGFSYLGLARWEYRTRLAQTREPVNQMIRARLFEQRLDAHEQAARKTAARRPDAAWSPRSAAHGADDAEPDFADLGGE
jgi:hypothetical protein